MKKLILFLSLITIFGYLYYVKQEEVIIPDEAIRFRIIPNSNSLLDLSIKEKTKQIVNQNLNTENLSSLNDTREEINSKKQIIKSKIETMFQENNYNKKVNIVYGLNYFPKKEYKGVTYKEGYYESLVVKIGNAKGNNFWCVLYPPLCLMDESNTNTSEKKYKIFIKEIISNYL